jgi:hypothetical protein
MSLTITDTLITSDEVDDTAEFRPDAAADGHGAWVMCTPSEVMYGFASRLLTRNQAITVMTIAEEQARPQPDQALIASLESELS